MTQAFNLSQFANKVNTSGQADLTTAVTGILPVANGGTGAATLTANNIVLGNGTSAVTFVAPGASGNILTSNGTTWTSSAPSGGGAFQTQLFTTPGTWTKPASATQVRVTVVAGGGGGSNGSGNSGTPTSGGSSSFGTLVSATGGGGANPTNGTGSPGSGTVTTGTAIRVGGLPNGPFSSISLNDLIGTSSPSGASVGSPAPYNYTSGFSAIAGAGGNGSSTTFGGGGGFAIAICPVSAPVAITVGSGGIPNTPPNMSPDKSATNGAVLVEYVG